MAGGFGSGRSRHEGHRGSPAMLSNRALAACFHRPECGGFNVADVGVVKAGASLASVNQHLRHRVDRHIAHPRDRPHGGPLAKHGEDLDALLSGQFVHAPSI
jgi:hypothetical protein